MATTPIPPCPSCHRINHVEEEEQSGSSSRWFSCASCGTHYPMPKLPTKSGRPATITHLPPEEAAFLHCPSCQTRLSYLSSISGGVEVIEQWDSYACRRCGSSFEYRQRTRRLSRSA